ncbi:MAG TPA: cytochrome c [Nitrospiria bacterium]|jgi:mono/diheme cytochrome c family protein
MFKNLSILIKAVILLIVVYVGVKLIQPPLPFSMVMMYMVLTLIAILVYVSLFEDKSEEFYGPISRFLAGGKGQSGVGSFLRIGVLIIFPLFIGMNVYGKLAPSDQPPAEQRVVHPAPPSEFMGLSNPVPKTKTNIQYGGALFSVYCAPCHGGKLDGKGPQAHGFNPPPANFKDPTTIAMLQESYLFWRIKNGGVGLPVEGQPWNSAMPRWGKMPARGGKPLSDEDIWKIIHYEFSASGHEPRTWE